MKKIAGLILTVGIILSSTICGAASKFVPTKEFTFVVPFEAGGNSDIPARIFAKYMTKYSKTEVKVLNLPGAGGRSGAKEVMKAKPDGYTFIQQPVGYPMQAALGVADFTYENFQPIGYWLDSSLALVVNAKSDYKTMKDLIAAAKKAPGQVKMGSVTGTLPLFAVLEVEKQKKITFKKVDLAGGSKAPELLGNRIDGYIDGFGSVKQFVDGGQFRCLGIITDQRLSGYENIPTFKELGFKKVDFLKQTFGLWAPKGTPKAAVNYINNLVKQAAEDPGCIKELGNLSYIPKYASTKKYIADMKQVYADFRAAAQGLIK